MTTPCKANGYYSGGSPHVQIKGDSSAVLIYQNASFILTGEEIKITVIPNNLFPHKINKILIGGSQIVPQKDGSVVMTNYGGSPGKHEIQIEVIYIDSEEKYRSQNYSVHYEVGQANVCIVLENMNILYTGVNNKVWIHVAGTPEEAMTVQIKGGEIKKIGAGEYNVKVTEITDEGELYVYVNEKVRGVYSFRVRHLPTPLATVGGYTSGDSVSASVFTAQSGVGSYLKDFPIAIKHRLVGYTINVIGEKGEVRSIENKGAAFSSSAKEHIRQHVKPGTMVILGNLFAETEVGKKMKLTPLIYHIK